MNIKFRLRKIDVNGTEFNHAKPYLQAAVPAPRAAPNDPVGFNSWACVLESSIDDGPWFAVEFVA